MHEWMNGWTNGRQTDGDLQDIFRQFFYGNYYAIQTKWKKKKKRETMICLNAKDLFECIWKTVWQRFVTGF